MWPLGDIEELYHSTTHFLFLTLTLFFFFFAVLQMEPRLLHLRGTCHNPNPHLCVRTLGPPGCPGWSWDPYGHL
jgi:hypothetical protein